MKKSNHGFTLVELVVTMAVASVVLLAATTVLTSFMRISKQGADLNIRQNEVRVVLEVMENLASEKAIAIERNLDDWKVQEADTGETLFYYSASEGTSEGKIYSGAGTILIEGVKESTAELEGNLLMLTVKTEKGEYATSVYCRRLEKIQPPAPEEPPVTGFSLSWAAAQPQTTDSSQVAYMQEREKFLSVLEAEVGSTGASLTTGEYFSEWYIGSYADNPGWNAETPWCACFISWAVDQCSEDLAVVPRYAKVEDFRSSFDVFSWKTYSPDPGDIIFFDWVVNETDYAQHVGVVTAVENGIAYTIEGNADGQVARRAYMLDDPRILGYGVLSWT